MQESDAGLPAHVRELSQACCKFVKDALGLELDYTPLTLPLLDHYVRMHVQTPSAEIIALLTPPLGAYFGEVVRTNLSGARWHAPAEDYAGYRIEFDGFFLAFNPLGVALEALTAQDAPGYGAHFQVLDEARGPLEAMLDRQEDVSEADYYSFTVRYETLESVTALLLALESKHSPHPRHFGPSVYRAAAGELDKGSPS